MLYIYHIYIYLDFTMLINVDVGKYTIIPWIRWGWLVDDCCLFVVCHVLFERPVVHTPDSPPNLSGNGVSLSLGISIKNDNGMGGGKAKSYCKTDIKNIESVGFSGTPNNGTPYPYYSHTTPMFESLKIWIGSPWNHHLIEFVDVNFYELNNILR